MILNTVQLLNFNYPGCHIMYIIHSKGCGNDEMTMTNKKSSCKNQLLKPSQYTFFHRGVTQLKEGF